MFNQLFRLVSFWRDFNRNQLIETYDQLFKTYQLKNLIDLYRLRLNQISKQNSVEETKERQGGALGGANMGGLHKFQSGSAVDIISLPGGPATAHLQTYAK